MGHEAVEGAMSEIEQKLSDSIGIVAENNRLKELVKKQRAAIALYHARLSIANIKLARARMDQRESRQQAG